MLADPQVVLTLQHVAIALLQLVLAVAAYYLGKKTSK